LAEAAHTQLVDELTRALKSTSLVDEVMDAARRSPTLVASGQLQPEVVKDLVVDALTQFAETALDEVDETFRSQGIALPGLAARVLEACRTFTDMIGDRVVTALA